MLRSLAETDPEIAAAITNETHRQADGLELMGDDAPAMTLATCGRPASQENASSVNVWPRALAKAASRSTISSLRGVA